MSPISIAIFSFICISVIGVEEKNVFLGEGNYHKTWKSVSFPDYNITVQNSGGIYLTFKDGPVLFLNPTLSYKYKDLKRKKTPRILARKDWNKITGEIVENGKKIIVVNGTTKSGLTEKSVITASANSINCTYLVKAEENIQAVSLSMETGINWQHAERLFFESTNRFEETAKGDFAGKFVKHECRKLKLLWKNKVLSIGFSKSVEVNLAPSKNKTAGRFFMKPTGVDLRRPLLPGESFNWTVDITFNK